MRCQHAMGRVNVTLTLLLLSGCSSFDLSPADNPQEVPVVGEWREVLAAPIEPGAVAELRVGGVEHDGNFANRGDIIVEFVDSDIATVELRPFSLSIDEALVQEDFDRLGLWAYVAPGVAPVRPEDMAVPKPCVGADTGTLRDGCALRVMFDGVSQPVRLGADIRLRLPIGFDGTLSLITEDNDWDEAYPDRSDVCVDPGARSVDVELERGRAVLSLDPTVAGGPVDARIEGDAAEVTVDIASGALANLTAGYKFGDGAVACDATFDLEGFEITGGLPGTDGNSIAGQAGPTGGTPVDVSASNEACEQVDLPDADPEQRGNIHFCQDCLGSTPCNQLIDAY